MNEDLLRKASDALQKAVNDKNQKRLEQDRTFIVSQVGKDLAKTLEPVLNKIAANSKINQAQIYEAVARAIGDAELKVEKQDAPIVHVPDVIVPDIHVPTPVVNYTPPAIHIPDIKMPDKMNVEGWVSLMGVSLDKPLPVQLRDASGKPVNLLENLTTLISSGGSGGRGVVKVSGYDSSAFGLMLNADGRLRVETNDGASSASTEVKQVSGTADSVVVNDILAVSTSFGVNQVSGANFSVKVTSFDTSVAATLIDSSGVGYSGDNPLPITGSISLAPSPQVSGYADSVNVMQYGGTNVPTGLNETTAGVFRTVIMTDSVVSVNVVSDAIALTDTQLRASPVQVQQVSGYSDSVNVVTTVGLTQAQLIAQTLDVKQLSGSVDSVIVNSGTLTGITNSLEVKQVSGFADSVFITGGSGTVFTVPVNVAGLEYDSDNPQPVYLIAGSGNSTISVGAALHDAADDGSAPVKIGGQARTTNPAAVADGDIANFRTDDLGRQITRPVQVRDLTVTAYATFATGTEATLLAGVAATYLDLIYILASNNSTAAIGIDIRPSTAGSIVMHLEIPANGVVGVSTPVPIPQQATGDGTGGTWTVDLPDVTGTTVSVSALFSKEI